MYLMLIIVLLAILLGIYALSTKSMGVEPIGTSIRKDIRRLGLILTAAGLLGITLQSEHIQKLEDAMLTLLVIEMGMLLLLLGNMKTKS